MIEQHEKCLLIKNDNIMKTKKMSVKQKSGIMSESEGLKKDSRIRKIVSRNTQRF